MRLRRVLTQNTTAQTTEANMLPHTQSVMQWSDIKNISLQSAGPKNIVELAPKKLHTLKGHQNVISESADTENTMHPT